MPDNNPPVRNNPSISPARVTTYTEVSGPIPSPQILQQYNNIVPGAAERIIRMAEKQSDHRMALENAGIIAALDIGGLVWVAVTNTKSQREEREKRQVTSSAPPSAKR